MTKILQMPISYPKVETPVTATNIQIFASILEEIGIDHVSISNEVEIYARIRLWEVINHPFIGVADENGKPVPTQFPVKTLKDLRGMCIRCQLLNDKAFKDAVTKKALAYFRQEAIDARK